MILDSFQYMNALDYFELFFMGVLASGALVLLMHRLAIPLGLMDVPCERKDHNGQVPLVGGMAVYIATAVILLFYQPHSVDRDLYLVASAIIVFIGVLDDKYDLTVRSRLIGQSLVALILIAGLQKHFFSLGDLFSIGTTIELYSFGIPFTVLAVLALINAFNMIDGIDGLLGFVSAVFYGFLGVQALLSGSIYIFITCLVLVACLIPFLAANLGFAPVGNKKIFMGDAGSMFMGLTVVWLTVEATQSSQPIVRPVTVLFFAALPIIDMIAIIIRRIKKGKSPLVADRDHIHHIFMRGGLSPRQTLLVLVTLSFMSAFFGLMLERFNVPDVLVLASFICLCVAYSIMVQHSWKFCRWLRSHFTK
ncbi:UDP-N-acetylglucosamine--undecaprenyl-phosphate N-acetylglucosaminephosphotransferase [Pseudoalteromonas rubra]|uniref:Undecaprenyl-phosphate alpha-N-acetylglucosaminyl 1-phosphate transferase n=1 Tax=Pseudoalteromonas rubra TaxID=43658 RepID=A0A5S3X0T7_9GAMM|nr:UDP-N-acetylglucosamine--undecaprenyl-phosphate N-acetylglucosaminephosphotransferase [Pseudoalteromonas rubra]TMP36623.1 undecaprenyl-phosphate alpha-N-acetylglucosaminyl 1-phosphate transferase [Pseudoalteromonas rubra]